MRELRGKESTRHRADKRGEEDCWIPSLGRPAPYSSLGASRRIIALRHRGFSIRHVGGGSVGLSQPFSKLGQANVQVITLKPPSWLRFVGKLNTKRSEEHTSELQSLMRISYAVFC